MILIELFVPAGALARAELHDLGRRLTTALMGEDQSAPAEVVEVGLGLTQVVVHQPESWFVAGLPVGSPRFVVRLTVPASWRKDMSDHAIGLITRVLAAGELVPPEDVWVYVVGISEGSAGIAGRPMSSTDLVRLITEPYRSGAAARPAVDLPAGTALDPVCGMTVPLDQSVAVVEHEGTTYAFCSAGCRAVFAEDVRV
jgi:YHS domain-containing protein